MADEADKDAAAIVLRLRADEQWISRVTSCEIFLACQWRRTPEAIERRRAMLSRQFPGRELTVENFAELAAISHDRIEMGWDARRVYLRHDDSMRQGRMDHRVWDGIVAIAHQKYRRPLYALRDSPVQYFAGMVTSHMGWPAVGQVDFWFAHGGRFPDSVWGLPESFAITGRELFCGVECDVLESAAAVRKLYVGLRDGRLYGGSRRHGSGGTFAYRFARHREVADGCWMPMHIEHDVWSEEGVASYISAMRVVDVETIRLNEPIADERFQIEMTEGVRVNDMRGPVPLFYQHKKHFEPEEWKGIVEECTQQHERYEARQAALKGNIGRTPPPLPNTRWFNSPPLTWEQLRGQTVLLHFFTMSQQSRSELPLLAELQRERREKLAIVGVYMPSQRDAIVQRIADEQGYPICIDEPTDDSPAARGVMANAMGVAFLPYGFIIDPSGKVTGHGQAQRLLYPLRATTQRAAE